MERLNLQIVEQGTVANVTIESTLRDQIVAAQRTSKGIAHIKEKVRSRKPTCFRIDETGILWFKNRLVVPKVPELHQQILDEAHLTR